MNRSINETIASNMESLSTLSTELSDATLENAAEKLCGALLQGGKIILVTDDASAHCDNVLVALFKQGEPIERPSLPLTSLRLLNGSGAVSSTDPLAQLHTTKDQLLIICKQPDSFASNYASYNPVYISGEPIETDANATVLKVSFASRAQWQSITTVLCNHLIESIESRLFGF